MNYWPAIIAASAAIVGTAIGASVSMLSSWLERKHRRTTTLLQKLEDLTLALRQTTEWREHFEGTTAFQDSANTHPAIAFFPLESLTILYFPGLQTAVSEYTAKLRSYHSWALRHFVDADHQPPELLLSPQSLATRLGVLDQAGFQAQHNELQRLHKVLADAIGNEARTLLWRS
ncbi:MAG: hypothetical protein K8R46_13460 [Pirellulales bacterium]|nr:hypothetical protein [Pirellulales bacterium]